MQGTVDGGQELTLLSGSGAITFTGTVGGTTQLTALTINSTGSGNINIKDIGDTNTVGVLNTTAIGNTTTGTLELGGTTYKTNTATYTAETGENIDLTGGSTTTFTTSNDDITFGTATVELGEGSDLVIDTDTSGGAIKLPGGVMGTSSENITFTAGTGNVTVGAIGTGSEKITNPKRDAIMGSPRGTDAIAVGDKYLIE